MKRLYKGVLKFQESYFQERAEVLQTAFRQTGIMRVSSRQVRIDPLATARAVIDRMQHVADHFLIHFDVDAMDVNEFPATDAQHEHGLSAADAAAALGEFAKSPRCVGMVVTEYNPDLDRTGACARKLIDIFGAVLADLPA